MAPRRGATTAEARALGEAQAASGDHSVRDWSVEPASAAPTRAATYSHYRKHQRRSPAGWPIPNEAPPADLKTNPPPGVRLVPDVDGVHFWTDPYGAAILAGVARRTLYAWKNKGWLKTRYMASAKLEIRVDSLWWSPEEREQLAVPPTPPEPAAPVGEDEDTVPLIEYPSDYERDCDYAAR